LFTNLLINAYEAMDGSGRVAITTATVQQDRGGETREAVRIEVQDSGPGMPPDVAEHVFDPFFTTKAQGSGLGLAIVRKIVDAPRRTDRPAYAPGSGTLVRVTLPVSVSRDGE
jgi:signal transduction histidine kinase